MRQDATSDQDRRERATRRVDLLRGFYGHALIFAVVNLGLIGYNLATEPGRMWFAFTFVGWGIGLVAHGLYAIGSERFLGAEWQERQIRAELERDRRRRG